MIIYQPDIRPLNIISHLKKKPNNHHDLLKNLLILGLAQEMHPNLAGAQSREASQGLMSASEKNAGAREPACRDPH